MSKDAWFFRMTQVIQCIKDNRGFIWITGIIKSKPPNLHVNDRRKEIHCYRKFEIHTHTCITNTANGTDLANSKTIYKLEVVLGLCGHINKQTYNCQFARSMQIAVCAEAQKV